MEIKNRKEILLAIQNNLPPYVAQNYEPLINRAVFKWTPSVNYFETVLGLRCKSNITLMDIDIVLQACACGWTPQGNVTLEPAEIDVKCIKVMDALCDNDLACTYGQWYVNRFTKGKESWQVSFEEKLVTGILAKVMLANENLIWKGDTASSDPSLQIYDGLIKQLTATSAPTITTSGSMLAQLAQINASIPVEAFNFGSPIIFIGVDQLRAVQAEIPFLNWFNPISPNQLDPTNPAPGFILPGTSTRVVGVIGLNGTGLAIGTFEGNFYYGSDFMDDQETVDFWYSKDHQEWRYAIQWFAGVTAILPEYAVVATLAPVDLSSLGILDINIASPRNTAGTAVLVEQTT